MTYRPPGYFQIDGSTYEHFNCVLATSTDLIDRSTVGTLRVAASRLRTITGDTIGGVTYEQAAAAVLSATGGKVKLLPRYGLSRTQVHDLATAGIPFGISIDCSVTRYTPFHTGTYTGGHTVYVQGYNAAGTYTVEDPGTSASYLDWPADLLYRAAEKRGGGKINVLVGADTEGVSRIGLSGRIRATASLTGVDKGAVVAGKAYLVAATVNGGGWKRADNGTSTGWHHVAAGYITGKDLK